MTPRESPDSIGAEHAVDQEIDLVEPGLTDPEQGQRVVGIERDGRGAIDIRGRCQEGVEIGKTEGRDVDDIVQAANLEVDDGVMAASIAEDEGVVAGTADDDVVAGAADDDVVADERADDV